MTYCPYCHEKANSVRGKALGQPWFKTDWLAVKFGFDECNSYELLHIIFEHECYNCGEHYMVDTVFPISWKEVMTEEMTREEYEEWYA